MNKSTLLFFIALVPLFSFSQELTLSGKVEHIGVGISTDKKIYFTFDDAPFSEQNFLTYNEQYEYKWSVSIGQLKKDSVKSVFFTAHVNISDELLHNSCGAQEIRLDSLLNKFPLSKQKNIDVDCDLILDLNCPPPTIFDRVSDWNTLTLCVGPFCAKLTGEYIIDIDNVTNPLYLDNISNYVVVKEVEKGLFPEKFGRWKYDSTSQILTLTIWIKRNEELGLLKRIETESYNFKVSEADMKFESNEYKLRKIN